MGASLETRQSHAAAETVLRSAFDRRYRYPDGFDGFRARVRFGSETSGSFAVVSMLGAGDVSVVPDESGCDTAWAEQELRTLSRTLWAHDYAIGEGRFHKSLLADPHPLGPLVVLHDDPHQATFRVADERITLMTRRHGTLLETVRIEGWHDCADGTLLPTRWIASLWDDSLPEPLRTDRTWDLYKPLAGEMLPLLRRVESTTPRGPTVSILAFSAWEIEGFDLDVD